MKLVCGRTTNEKKKEWGIALEGTTATIALLRENSNEDYTAKHFANHIVECVNALDGIKDIKKFMEDAKNALAEKDLLG